MKVYCSIVVGQEIDGKNVVVKIEKASVDKSKIEAMQSLKNPWTENFQVPDGNVKMLFQRNFQEFEVDDATS